MQELLIVWITLHAGDERRSTFTTQLMAAAEAPAPRFMPTDVNNALVVKTDSAPPKKYCTPRQPMYSLYCGETDAGYPCGMRNDAHRRPKAMWGGW